MRSPKTKGRMINQDISDSKGFAALTPEAAVLFVMMIPHFTPYGKLNGDPCFIKGEICPRIDYLQLDKIESCLKEITEHTNVKWFCHDGRWWIHSINFLSDHQNIKLERCGSDQLPNYSGLNQEQIENLSPTKLKFKIKKDIGTPAVADPSAVADLSVDAPTENLTPDEMCRSWNEKIKNQGNGCVVPKILMFTPARKKKCMQRISSLKLNSKRWLAVVSKIHENDFLSGRSPSKNNSGWKATFDWVIKNDDIMLKIVEGAYDQ